MSSSAIARDIAIALAVVRPPVQVVDATAGDYGEPEYVVRLGEVPANG